MTVYLVGAGPGDPGLLTMRAAELLRLADVVIYDRLAHPSLLGLAPFDAILISVGKAPGNVEMDQDGINAALVEHGRSSRVVVRLKGGDPFVFGRGGEEAEVLSAAGVAFEVVPGITSAVAAPAYAGIPVTHRGLSTHFTVVTGHEDPAKGRSDTDWEALAKTGGTLVVLMGAKHLSEISARLMAGGLSPDTPVAAVRWGTRPDQSTVRATLGTIADAGVQAPSAIVIGAVAAMNLAWFETRPLQGRTIVVTRAREQASELATRLELLGASVIEFPTIAIEEIEFDFPALHRYAWLVFTSPNGVEAFFEQGLAKNGFDSRALAHLRIAAVGPSTARALTTYGINADLVPEKFVAESLLESFPVPGAPGERILLAVAEQARDALPNGLVDRGHVVDVLAVYRTVAAKPRDDQLDLVRDGTFDAITFTSSSTVTNFCDLVSLGGDVSPLVVSIGPITSATVQASGMKVGIEANPHTIDGVVEAVVSGLA